MAVAFRIVFGTSRTAPPETNEDELAASIREQVPGGTDEGYRNAAVRIQKLSSDTLRICDAFRDGKYGTGSAAQDAAVKELKMQNPHFSDAEYRQAFAAGMMWTAF